MWDGAHTIAAGLRVPRALGDFLVLRAVRETGGSAVAVDDETMLEAIGRLARTEGILASPEGAATLAGAEALRARGDLRPDERVVLVVTGSGLSDRDALERAASRR
jgi:threonine synthase